MGCIYGVYVEFIIFGVKMVFWYIEMKCNFKCFKEVCKEIEVGKMSGVVGIFVNILFEIEVYVCEYLGIDIVVVFI